MLRAFFFPLFHVHMSSVGCKFLCIVISFLAFWFIFLSSLVHFKNGPEYLSRKTVQVFILLMGVLLKSLVSRSVLVRLRYSYIFSPISACLMVSTPNTFKYLYFFYSPSILILSWKGSSIPFVIGLFPLLVISMAHFSVLNFIPISWLYFVIACISSLQFFFIVCIMIITIVVIVRMRYALYFARIDNFFYISHLYWVWNWKKNLLSLDDWENVKMSVAVIMFAFKCLVYKHLYLE